MYQNLYIEKYLQIRITLTICRLNVDVILCRRYFLTSDGECLALDKGSNSSTILYRNSGVLPKAFLARDSVHSII